MKKSSESKTTGKTTKDDSVAKKKSTSSASESKKEVVKTTSLKKEVKFKEEDITNKKLAKVKKANPPKKDIADKKAIPKAILKKNLPDIIHVVLQLNYHTQEGESIWVTSSSNFLGDTVIKEMQYEDNDHWKLHLVLHSSTIKDDITYQYHIRKTDGSFQDDYESKTFEKSWLNTAHIFIRDFWGYAGYIDNIFYKKPFEFIFSSQLTSFIPKKKATTQSIKSHLFEIKVPYISGDIGVCLLGEAKELGSWQEDKYVKLDYNPLSKKWEKEIAISTTGNIAYKYAFYNTKTKKIIKFEDGANRQTFGWLDNSLVVQNDGFFLGESSNWKGAGLNIPLFSIRTQYDYGVGDFGSVKPLIDWMASVGLKLLQFLPINDTSLTGTWTDSYPYAAVSAFALHPIYIDVTKVLTDDLKKEEEIVSLLAEGKKLNNKEEVDYEAVYALKLAILKKAFYSSKKNITTTVNYKKFLEINEKWLKPYAVFCVLRDKFNTSDFYTWKNAETYSDAVFNRVWKTNKENISFYFYVQYSLHNQLLEVQDYAHSKRVVLKGDIAIGVGRHSADVWANPSLFHVEMQAGAPPDYFVKEGQNWGFPTYNWEQMEKNGYQWWQDRLHQLSQYFDAVRLDHILGFFRIWSIPYEQTQGILGYFQPVKPINQDEFSLWNLSFDYDRYCKPYINDTILNGLFGDKTEDIKNSYLESNYNGTYRFKESFDTQRKIKNAFENLPNDSWVLPKLMSLVANVLLIPDKIPSKYHCRFVLYETSSYLYLNDWEKKQFYYLYINYFYQRQDSAWQLSGYKKMQAIASNTDMMVCGEDLGMVPSVVPIVMNQLGYLGLRVQRMSSDSQHTFTNPKDVSYLNVVTPSTHDLPPIRNWWESETIEKRNLFWNEQLLQDGNPPSSFTTELAENIVDIHLASPAIWSIFLIQDLLSLTQETWSSNMELDVINKPEIAQFYWRYRMPITVEQLNKSNTLIEKINNLINNNHRNQ